jgi:iron complex outermembrane receptor protein
VRAVIYDDSRGGYIDNVPATFTRKNTDIGIHYANYPTGCADLGAGGAPVCQVPPGSPVINNNSVAARAINPVTYQGVRVEALYKFNDEWDALITQSYQDMHSQGVF